MDTPLSAPVPTTQAPAAAPAADPFVSIWQNATKTSGLRAMELPNGCIVQRQWVVGTAANGSPIICGAICFVPDVSVKGYQLILSNETPG
jgi:hypothetical protein